MVDKGDVVLSTFIAVREVAVNTEVEVDLLAWSTARDWIRLADVTDQLHPPRLHTLLQRLQLQHSVIGQRPLSFSYEGLLCDKNLQLLNNARSQVRQVPAPA